MEHSDICRVCGHPLNAHGLVMRFGVAHAAINIDGHWRSCSEEVADYNFARGERGCLKTIIRSLRIHAGRLRNRDLTWQHWHLSDYSNKLADRLEPLDQMLDQYYGWARK